MYEGAPHPARPHRLASRRLAPQNCLCRHSPIVMADEHNASRSDNCPFRVAPCDDGHVGAGAVARARPSQRGGDHPHCVPAQERGPRHRTVTLRHDHRAAAGQGRTPRARRARRWLRLVAQRRLRRHRRPRRFTRRFVDGGGQRAADASHHHQAPRGNCACRSALGCRHAIASHRYIARQCPCRNARARKAAALRHGSHRQRVHVPA